MHHRHHHEVTHHQPSDKLHVIAVLSNPVGYNSRYHLFKQFQEEMKKWNVELHVVELAFNHRAFEVTDPSNPLHVQVRGFSELWHKENLINIGFQHLPHDWKYAAWVDADISFMNPKWVEDTIHQLHHHPIVQLFQNAIDLGPNGEIMQTHTGLGYQFVKGIPPGTTVGEYGSSVSGAYWHPGFAWAITREGLEATGPLIDYAIAGAGDHHMAMSWVGMGARSLPGGVSDAYKKLVLNYEKRCEKHLQHNIGFVPGSITHHFHGKKKDRKYLERWGIITKNQFNPHEDIIKNYQGVYELAGNKSQLRDDIRAYFRQRNEDSVDVE